MSSRQQRRMMHDLRPRKPEEELVNCIVCYGQATIVSFKTKQNNPNNTKTIFKCKKCGQVMIRLETWPKKHNKEDKKNG